MQRMLNNSLYLWLLLAALAACNPASVETAAELIAYTSDEEKGLLQKRQVGSLNVSLSYRPSDLMVVQHLQGKRAEKQEWQELAQHYGNYLYFVLSISQSGSDPLYGQGMEGYSDKLQRLAYQMPEYTYLTTAGSDTIYLADFNFPRLYGKTGSTQVLLAYEREKIREADGFSLHLKELGLGTGNLSFEYKTKDIEKVPRLEFPLKGQP